MELTDSPRKYFQSAMNLIGESWLNSHLSSDENSTDTGQAEYNVPIENDVPPPIVKEYRMANEDIQHDRTEVIELPEWRNKSLEFLRLGWVYRTIQDIPIISPQGDRLSEVTVEQLFRDRLRSYDEFNSSRYEMEVAATYEKIGHSPAFIHEEESKQKTPDIELIDTSPNVQIECKRCRKQSDEERKQSNRAKKLFRNIQSQPPQESYVAIIELDHTPEKSEVEDVQYDLPSAYEIKSNRYINAELSFGEITIIPLPNDRRIRYPANNVRSFSLMQNLYDDLIKPVISSELNTDSDFSELDNSVLLFEAKNRPATLLIRNINFIAIRESTWGQNIYNRLRSQFTDVSKKFDEKPSVLHIDFPDMNEGDSVQRLELRKHIGGELKPRPDISGVVISGTIYHPVFSEKEIDRHRIEIPHYQPTNDLPDDYRPIDPESAKSVDEIMKNSVNEEFLRDPDGDKKAISQQEGTLSFRFKPNERRPQEEEKFIFDIVSEDENTRMSLSVTSNENLQLRRLDVKTGYWSCNVDIDDFPEFDPLRIFITWSTSEVSLSVGHQSNDELISDHCTHPINDIEKIDGIPRRASDSS